MHAVLHGCASFRTKTGSSFRAGLVRRILALLLTLPLAPCPFGCTKLAAAEASLGCVPGDGGTCESATRPVASPLVGDTSCAYGTYGCNRCVPDVPRAFVEGASGSRDVRTIFRFAPKGRAVDGVQPDKFAGFFQDHIQGVTRVPGLGTENWLAFSRNARDAGDAAFYLTWFEGLSSDGDAFKYASERTSNTARDYFYYRIPSANHAGGIQALGPMLFVAAECDSGNECLASVQIYDVRDPAHARRASELVIDGSRGELDFGTLTASSRAAAVGAARLADGTTMLFVIGRQPEHLGWFFRSDRPEIDASTEWELVDRFHESRLPPGTPWHPWENVDLLTQCGDGALYAIAMGTRSEKSFLYRITEQEEIATGNHVFNFEYVAGRGLNTSGITTTTRAGSGVHVTPGGELVSYVSSRTPDAEIDEFRYHEQKGD